MKKLIWVYTASIILGILMGVAIVSADITLDVPQEITAAKTATKIKVIGYKHDTLSKTIKVDVVYFDASDNPIRHVGECTIENIPATDTEPAKNLYTQTMNANVTAAQVDKNRSVIWINTLQNKCKTIMNLSGTEN